MALQCKQAFLCKKKFHSIKIYLFQQYVGEKMAGMMKSIPLSFYFLVPLESVSIKNSSCSYNAECIVKHLKNSSFNHHAPALHFELACLIYFSCRKNRTSKTGCQIPSQRQQEGTSSNKLLISIYRDTTDYWRLTVIFCFNGHF